MHACTLLNPLNEQQVFQTFNMQQRPIIGHVDENCEYAPADSHEYLLLHKPKIAFDPNNAN